MNSEIFGLVEYYQQIRNEIESRAEKENKKEDLIENKNGEYDHGMIAIVFYLSVEFPYVPDAPFIPEAKRIKLSCI
jgi:hypothetical protein